MNDEITPKEFFVDLNYLQRLKDTRLLILFLHLYTEHFVNEISKEKRVKIKGLMKKVELLVSMKVIDSKLVEIIDLINDLRNQLIHNLKPDQKLLERWIEDFEAPFTPLREDAPIVFDEIKKFGIWEKIQIYSIPVVINLFKKLKELRKEKIDYDIVLEWNTALNIWGFKYEKVGDQVNKTINTN
jgi:hypothetical protein